jgi:uncharacterized protein YjiS (DUF1127 family)
MNAPLSKEQLARLSAANLDYHGQCVDGLSTPAAAVPAREGALSRWLHAAATRWNAFRERRRAIGELSQLTDRDLADMGLHRTQLHLVFDPAFARARREGISD